MTCGSDGLCALQSFTLHQGMFGLQAKELAEAQERMRWHEMMSRRNIDNSEALQARPAPADLSRASAYAILSSREHYCIKQGFFRLIAGSYSAWLCELSISEVGFVLANGP